jgi:hypothetical protein
MPRRSRELTEEEIDRRARARLSALEDQAEHDLGCFIELRTPQYDAPEHLRPLLDALDRSMREPVFALVEAAPRHGKTDTILHGCARRLRYRPEDHVQYCTYSSPLAFRKSRKTREIAARAGVWIGDEERRRNRFDAASAVSYWETIRGGSFTAGGLAGQFVGSGSNLTVFDDPFKNRDQAESPVYQEKVMETWKGSLANRIEPGGSAFVTHQPWNDLDPIAQLRAEKAGGDGQDWEVISLPAVIDAVYDRDDNLIGGMPLWPARWTLRELAKVKRRVGPYNWYSQYTLDRRPRGDRLFHDPARYVTPTVNGAVVVISCDPGIEKDTKRDSSGIVVGACYRKPSPYHRPGKPHYEVWIDVLLAVEQWRDIPDLVDYLETLQTDPGHYPGAPVILEEVSAFKALSQIASRVNSRARFYPVTPKGNKFLRAQPAALAWNQGRIRVPLDEPWALDFIREAQRFTGREGGRDNRVDALTQLYDYCERLLAAYAEAVSGGESMMASSPF